MEDDLNGRQPQWKTTTMEDDHNERRPQMKTTSIEDELNGRRSQWKTTSRKPYLKQTTLASLASQFCTELGPAQPQLVISIVNSSRAYSDLNFEIRISLLNTLD